MNSNRERAACPYPFATVDEPRPHARFAELQAATPMLWGQLPYDEAA